MAVSHISQRTLLAVIGFFVVAFLLYTLFIGSAQRAAPGGSTSAAGSAALVDALSIVRLGGGGGAGGSGGESAAARAVAAARNVHRIAVVTDLDHGSKVTDEAKPYWRSFYQEATLTRNPDTGRYSVVFDDDRTTLRTRLSLDGRGMELSWLQRFGSRYYTGDDRSGVLFEVRDRRAIAAFVLPDGDGTEEKGYKSEWAAVKDDNMYVGSFGKEWSSDTGERINNNPMWIKVINRFGGVTHVDWTPNYEALRRACGYEFPSYLFHEAAAWSDTLQRWVFVPRRASKEPYNPDVDETKGTNLILIADADFRHVDVRHVDFELDPSLNPRGFSEIKFVPGRSDIVALKSMEYKGETKSWITVFDLDGNTLMDDVPIGDAKYEGLEFLD